MKCLIDFDGVLVKRPGIIRTKSFVNDPPMEDAVDAIESLILYGHDVVIFTARDSHDWPQIREWLKKHHFPEVRITNIKEPATMYIDDRAVRFTTWQDVCKYLL